VLIKVVKAKDTAKGLPYNNFTLPVFIYKLDAATGYHEPRGVFKRASGFLILQAFHFECDNNFLEKKRKKCIFF